MDRSARKVSISLCILYGIDFSIYCHKNYTNALLIEMGRAKKITVLFDSYNQYDNDVLQHKEGYLLVNNYALISIMGCTIKVVMGYTV